MDQHPGLSTAPSPGCNLFILRPGLCSLAIFVEWAGSFRTIYEKAMAYSEASSMIGCSMAQCIDRADPDFRERQAAKRGRLSKPRTLQAAVPGDEIPAGMCRRCGLVGEHGAAVDCFDALRSMVADLQTSRPPCDAPRSGAHLRRVT